MYKLDIACPPAKICKIGFNIQLTIEFFCTACEMQADMEVMQVFLLKLDFHSSSAFTFLWLRLGLEMFHG